ncbi:MAG: HDOD domain-containing protein [Gammaproteobacteria bacterium]|mgnify:FL=1|nr:MAG: HDOD domain-containing protein [Gammaproteobacteria bacterium]
MTLISTGVSPEIIENLSLFSDLPPDSIESLAKECTIEEYPAKTVVFRKGGADEYTHFVLSGVLVLVSPTGDQESLVGMGDSGVVDKPLGWEVPYEKSAIAQTDIRLINVKTDTVKQLLEDTKPPAPEVAEVDEGGEDVGTRIYFRLFQDLMEDKLDLPSMPDMAIRVREAVSNPDASAHDVSQIIQTDPVVTARIVQAANSALYTGQRQVDNVSAAVVRLGLSTTRELVMAVTMRDIFKSKSPLLNKRMVELWMHSTMVAAIASVLSKKIRGFSPDKALLAGLVHDIGVVPMLVHAGNYPELTQDPMLLEKTISEYKGQIGTMIMRKWNFPDDLSSLPADADEWMRDEHNQPDYTDLIVISQLHNISTGDHASEYPDVSETPAFAKLGLQKDDEGHAGLLIRDEAREEIAAVQKLLLGN